MNLINVKKRPLDDQLKRIDANTDIFSIFKDLHENPFTTPTQKQIMYRLLFGITPTSEGLAKRHRRIFFCKLCSLDQETEVHIFYECPFLNTIKLELIKLLKHRQNNHIDLFKCIFLNTLPTEANKNLKFLKLAFVALYRDAIWTARNEATHKNHIKSSNLIANMFICKTKYLLKLFKGNEAVQLFLNGYDIK